MTAAVCIVPTLAGGCSQSALINYEDWSAAISQTTFKSAICVEKKGNLAAQGSGMIFYEDNGYYYALTNNHVVYKETGEVSWLTVTDCYNQTTSASVQYSDADYDLAILAFPKPQKQLYATPLAESNPSKLQSVALISSPQGRHNVLTFGMVNRYETIEITTIGEEYSNITFPVMTHDIYSETGSSGGGIVNKDLQLVGLHYACGFSIEETFVEGYAVPVEKIREFLVAAEEAKGKEFGV